MGDQEIAGLALGLEVGEDVEDRGLDRDVERARRLVRDHDARVTRERPGDRDTLLEATRELARLRSRWRWVSRRSTRACRPGRLPPSLQAGELAHGAAQDRAHAPAAIERPIRVLEDDLDGALGVDGASCRVRLGLMVVELDVLAVIGTFDPEDRLGQGGLSRTGLPTRPRVSPSLSVRSTPTSAGTCGRPDGRSWRRSSVSGPRRPQGRSARRPPRLRM